MVTGHVPNAVPLDLALEVGMDCNEHLMGFGVALHERARGPVAEEGWGRFLVDSGSGWLAYDELSEEGTRAMAFSLQGHDHHSLEEIFEKHAKVLGDARILGATLYGAGGERLLTFGEAPSLAPPDLNLDRIERGSRLDGEISAVNGRIAVGGGSKVANDVDNVNGEIELAGSEIGGSLTTVNGDVELADGAVIRGDLVVERPGGSGWDHDNRKPRIVIGPGSRVEGVIRLEREVGLYISESAEVGGVEGEMGIDDAVRFSGKRP